MTQFADTFELLQYVDGAVIIAEAGKTTKEDVRRGLELVRSSGVRILGFVLNKASEAKQLRLLPLLRFLAAKKLGFGHENLF